MHRLCKRFVKTEFRHVPRVQNEFADALATLSSMIRHPDHNYIDPIHMNNQLIVSMLRKSLMESPGTMTLEDI